MSWKEALTRSLRKDDYSETEVRGQIEFSEGIVSKFSEGRKLNLVRYLNGLSRDEIQLVDWEALDAVTS